MPAGRPKLQLDESVIENYAKLGASNRDIAAMMGCDETVMRTRYDKIIGKARAERRTAIRKLQWDAAKAGNPALLIWLGKNELDQTDRATVEHSGEVGFSLEIGPQLRRHENSNGNGHRITTN